VSFYERITRDIGTFANKYANGKVVSVLEGGYSDKALTSAAMSHVAGFFPATKSRASWWQEAALSDVGHGLRNSALTATNALFTTDRSGNSQETEWSDSTFS
jgi:acetoin utilization deacetylase AcuC-like enzyme